MPTAAGRVFSGLTRVVVNRGIFVRNTSTARLNSVRTLAVTSQKAARSTDEDEVVKSEPIKFSTSKASHRAWKVHHSMGSQHERPWWKVLPISLFGISFLLWCALRKQTDVDAILEENLYKSLPDLLADEEEEQDESS